MRTQIIKNSLQLREAIINENVYIYHFQGIANMCGKKRSCNGLDLLLLFSRQSLSEKLLTMNEYFQSSSFKRDV
jgi:hypothetical protein